MTNPATARSARSPRVCVALAALTLCAAAHARPASAGDSMGGWFVLPAGSLGWTLHHAPADEPPGSVRRAALLRDAPALMAASQGKLVMAFEPPPTLAPSPSAPLQPSAAWSLRLISVQRLASDILQYAEPVPLPPAPIGLRLIALALDGPRTIALARPSDQGPAPSGATRAAAPTLIILGPSSWTDIPLPIDPETNVPASAPGHWSLLTFERHAALVRVRQDSATIWTASSAGPAPLVPQWAASSLAPARDLQTLGNTIITAVPDGPGAWNVSAVRAAAVVPMVRVQGVGPGAALVPVGGNLAWFWGDPPVTDPASPPFTTRILAKVITPSGALLRDGPASLASPIPSRDIEALALLLASMTAAIAAFVLRRDGAWRDAPIMPPGASLAAPGPRIAAGTIDVLIALALSALAWRQSPIDIILSFIDSSPAVEGVRPLATLLTILIVMGGVGEALFARTPGKLLTGLRTISASTGRKPTWPQAMARNAVKALCPPLAAFHVNPALTDSTGLFGTLVIRPAPAAEDPTPNRPDRDP